MVLHVVVQSVYDELMKDLKRVAVEGKGDPVLPATLLRSVAVELPKSVREAVTKAVDLKSKPELTEVFESKFHVYMCVRLFVF